MTGNQTASQTLVVVAMGLVASAGAVALYQHAGLPGPVAATGALSAYLLLLTVHAYVWRAGQKDAAQGQPRDRREQEVRRLKDDARTAPLATPAKGARVPLPPLVPAAQAPRAAQQPTVPATAQVPPPLPPLPRQAGDRIPPLTAAKPAPAASADDPQDAWSFRGAATPSEQRTSERRAPEQKLPPFVTGRISARPSELDTQELAPLVLEPTLPPLPQAAATGGPREADVEVIQDAIKRMLEDISAAEKLDDTPIQNATGHHAPHQGPPPLPAGAIDRSVDALRMTAGAMRNAVAPDARAPNSRAHEPAFAGPPPVPPTHTSTHAAEPTLPPFVRGARPASPSDTRARVMTDAISAGRIDVSLEPILGLEDQQTRHYEVTVRLRDANGHPLEITPDGPDLRGTGLLPLFDGVRITRTAAVARRLEERGKGGSVFSAFSGESIADEHFLGELAETLHQRGSLATQLVLSFTQSDVRGFSTPEWDSLADMRALGFRFALSAITDLDMDFEALAEQGFVFVKLDASVFLDGLPAPSGHLPSSDVCRHLASLGLTLVVERIDEEEQLARVFGFGVLLGQGQLFGGARAVRADVVASRHRASHAAA